MKKLLILFTLWCLQPAYAQLSNNPAIWHPGTLVLTSGTEINGKINYDLKTGVVQLKTAGLVKAFTPYHVQSFRFVEEQFGMMREFMACSFHPESRRTSKSFLEVVLKGPLMVFRKQENYAKVLPAALEEHVEGQPALFDYKTSFTYYVRVNDQFMMLKKFKKSIFPMMARQLGHEFMELVQEKKWRLYALPDQLRLINYYNYQQAYASTVERSPAMQGSSYQYSEQ